MVRRLLAKASRAVVAAGGDTLGQVVKGASVEDTLVNIAVEVDDVPSCAWHGVNLHTRAARGH